VGLVDYHRNFF